MRIISCGSLSLVRDGSRLGRLNDPQKNVAPLHQSVDGHLLMVMEMALNSSENHGSQLIISYYEHVIHRLPHYFSTNGIS